MDEVVETSTAAGVLPLQWPLVGRQGELDEFGAALDDPRAHGLVIGGPPGVGKTRLADEFLAVAARRGRTVGRATATDGAHHFARPEELEILGNIVGATVRSQG